MAGDTVGAAAARGTTSATDATRASGSKAAKRYRSTADPYARDEMAKASIALMAPHVNASG